MYFSYTDPSVRLTGRWDIRASEAAITTNPGAYFEIAFTGKILQLVFNLEHNEYPLPHLYLELDGGARFETSLDRRLRVIAESGGEHRLRVIYKSSTEALSRWRMPIHNALSFCGYDAEGAGALPPDNRKTIEFVGDSITEGVLVDCDYCKAPAADIDEHNRPFQDDATATYAWLTAERLNLRPVICGFGAVGLTRPGKGRVPACPISYPFNYEGSPISFKPCDIVVLNHGANDRAHSCEEYLAKYEETLLLLRHHNPDALIVSLSAFCGAFREPLAAFIPEFNKKHNERIAFIDTAGWIPLEPLHPLRPASIHLAALLSSELEKLIK